MSYIVKVPFIDREDKGFRYLKVGEPYPGKGRKDPSADWIAQLASENNRAKVAVIEKVRESLAKEKWKKVTPTESVIVVPEAGKYPGNIE